MFNFKYISPLVCGFGAAVLSIVPGLKEISCCIIVPLTAVLSLYLDQKMRHVTEKVDSRNAVTFGLLTGVFAAIFLTFFDTILTLFTRTNDFVRALPATEALIRDYNLGNMMEETMKILRKIAADIKETGFSLLYTFMMLISNLITDTVFGLLGGLIGMNYLNRKHKTG